ncbi:MAG TPA: bifunctional YncE family protein/alkaline phosphatase family protein [Bryobacteraceae bacterium]|nr:bifunctional YncE family protein/alkaline phosphatase family protein [Bryobacteraceae bacterium]
MKRACLIAILPLAWLCAQPSARDHVGPTPGGGFLLNSGWRIQPAGKQIPLDTFPMSTALSPDGKYLLVLNAGVKPPSISVIATDSARVVSTATVEDGWLGITFTPKGDRVYVGGGAHAAVYEYNFHNGTLQPSRTFPVVPANQRTARDFVGDVALSPDGRLLYAAELYHDSVAVINPQSGMVIAHYKTGRRPYRILFHPDGKSFFVTNWADGSLGQYDAATGSSVALVRLGSHPTDIVWRKGASDGIAGEPTWTARLFVAAANTNNVYAVGVGEGGQLERIESINLAVSPLHPLGMSPSALALSKDGSRLYVACSDANLVAAVDVSEDRSRVDGFIPTGWYPTAVRALASGTLVVLNGKGSGSHPSKAAGWAREQTGTASWIEPYTSNQLDTWTRGVFADSPYNDDQLSRASPLPTIPHVIYIVMGSHSYDEILGDVKEGNGDRALVRFGETVTPNQHKLAREFVLFDNFYANGDTSLDGLAWSTSAIATDYIQKLWPATFAKRRNVDDFEGQDPDSQPPAGYIWTNAKTAGLDIRNFGFFVNNKSSAPPGAEQVQSVHDSVLGPVTNRFFRGPDPHFTDLERAKAFVDNLATFEKTGSMPRLVLMRLSDGPDANAADQDAALGTIVEAVSKSPFWPSTAIFVVQTDAQEGADHVDAHRVPAFVISPYVRRHTVDSTLYSTASMLRTMEFLLGLRPMTQFDAGARPMTAAFQTSPDPAAFTAERPR